MDSLFGGEGVDEIAERIIGDQIRKELEERISSLKWKPQDMSEEDMRRALEQYEREGYIDVQGGQVRITSKGARKLANEALERILRNLAKKEVGYHSLEEPGFGAELSSWSRAYEVGDDYSLVDIERTLLNALERRGKVDLEPEDFQVYEELHQTKLCAGLIIDESGSMRSNHKLSAAIETSLALSELIRREPKDSLKVFIFSETVKEIPTWNIVNEVLGGGCTDIKAALRAFRKAVSSEQGDKQAYLITDTEPNTDDGRYVGFDRAVAGLIEEALRYRQEKITLNIIMLDESPSLKHLASILAQRNLGRVLFTSPGKLGEVVTEDYLRARKERIY